MFFSSLLLGTVSALQMELTSPGLPNGWKKLASSPDDHTLELLFAVKQTNLELLEETLLRISDPDSDSYGQYLSNEQVHEMVAPRQEDLATVIAFLSNHGAEGVSLTPNSDFLQATVTVAKAESMLGAEYFEMVHAESGKTVHRTLEYHLPTEVANALDFVAPTVHFPPIRSTVTMMTSPNAITNSPKVLRDLYSVGDAIGQAPGNKMAVTAFLEQHYHVKDLHSFWDMFCTPNNLTCGKGDPALVGDETTGLAAGVESMLDIQSITGVAGNILSEFWGFSGRSPDNSENEPFMKWLAQVSSTTDADVPKVFSTSYGEDEDSWSLDAATRMNTEFQKCGTRAISLLFASGDEGANCVSGRFKPETPGSSPWVTSVGGTFLSGTSAIGLSSGGFSDRWPQPDWQQSAVSNYLSTAANLPPTSAGYNVSGRAYPDIAAQASDFTVIANGIPFPGVAGTSCASPTAAGVIALLNDARLQAGQPLLGFLNPWIYKNMPGFNDITTGSNSGGRCGGGWPAVAGWDAATGVGSTNYRQLL
jgi:tripeptidyl-peptidase-1